MSDEEKQHEHDRAWADAARAIRSAFPDRAEAILAILEKTCPRCAGGTVLSRDTMQKLNEMTKKLGAGGVGGAIAGALVGGLLGASAPLLPTLPGGKKRG